MLLRKEGNDKVIMTDPKEKQLQEERRLRKLRISPDPKIEQSMSPVH